MDRRILVWGGVALAVGALFWSLTRSGVPGSGDIGNAELRKLVAEGARLVDVRTPSEYEAGHIPDAENVPVEQFQQTAAGWDKSLPIVVYCATGARSLNAAQWASANGFPRVYNLKAGIVAWDGELSTQPGVSSQTIDTSPSGLPVVLDFSSEG